jgi:hypothetical protein
MGCVWKMRKWYPTKISPVLEVHISAMFPVLYYQTLPETLQCLKTHVVFKSMTYFQTSILIYIVFIYIYTHFYTYIFVCIHNYVYTIMYTQLYIFYTIIRYNYIYTSIFIVYPCVCAVFKKNVTLRPWPWCSTPQYVGRWLKVELTGQVSFAGRNRLVHSSSQKNSFRKPADK